MSNDLVALFTSLLAILGPAPKDSTQELQLHAGDQIVAIGDSITAGGGYLRDIDAMLASQYPELKLPKVINVGISGQKAEDLIKRFEKDVLNKKPQVVTISIGINDVWHRLRDPHDPAVLEKYTENVNKMVELAQSAGIKVVLLTPTLIQEDAQTEGNVRLTQYVEAEKKIAAGAECLLADLHQMFLTVLAKRPDDVKDKWITRDGVHMNARGDALMALGVLRALGVPDSKIAGK